MPSRLALLGALRHAKTADALSGRYCGPGRAEQPIRRLPPGFIEISVPRPKIGRDRPHGPDGLGDRERDQILFPKTCLRPR